MLPKHGMFTNQAVCVGIIVDYFLHVSGQCQKRKIKVSILKVT